MRYYVIAYKISIFSVACDQCVAEMRTVEELVIKKREAVRYRLAGLSLAQVREQTGLSVPTIIKAYDAFQRHGWQGVEANPRGRKPFLKKRLQDSQAELLHCIQLATRRWQCFCSLDHILEEYAEMHKAISRKTLLRRLHDVLPEQDHKVLFELISRHKRIIRLDAKILLMGFFPMTDGCVFYTQDKRGERRFSWSAEGVCEQSLVTQLDRLIQTASLERVLQVVIKTDSLTRHLILNAWQKKHQERCVLFAQWSLTQAVDECKDRSIKR